MAKKPINKIIKWINSKLGILFVKVSENNSTILVSRDLILRDMNKDTVVMYLKSDLFPDDAAIITICIKDMISEFGYKELRIGDIFEFDDKLIYGEDAIKKFEEQQYNNIRQKVMSDMLLDMKLSQLRGFDC